MQTEEQLPPWVRGFDKDEERRGKEEIIKILADMGIHATFDSIQLGHPDPSGPSGPTLEEFGWDGTPFDPPLDITHRVS